jgi:uncharacterized protein YciI
MPKWAEYREIARNRGALALEFYIVESMPVGPPERIQEILPDHLHYQKKMETAGKLFLAGPLSDDTGEEMAGGGMIVYRAGSLEEARNIAVNDPMHKAGGRDFTIRRWLVNEGSLSLNITFSDQKCVPD